MSVSDSVMLQNVYDPVCINPFNTEEIDVTEL